MRRRLPRAYRRHALTLRLVLPIVVVAGVALGGMLWLIAEQRAQVARMRAAADASIEVVTVAHRVREGLTVVGDATARVLDMTSLYDTHAAWDALAAVRDDMLSDVDALSALIGDPRIRVEIAALRVRMVSAFEDLAVIHGVVPTARIPTRQRMEGHDAAIEASLRAVGAEALNEALRTEAIVSTEADAAGRRALAVSAIALVVALGAGVMAARRLGASLTDTARRLQTLGGASVDGEAVGGEAAMRASLVRLEAALAEKASLAREAAAAQRRASEAQERAARDAERRAAEAERQKEAERMAADREARRAQALIDFTADLNEAVSTARDGDLCVRVAPPEDASLAPLAAGFNGLLDVTERLFADLGAVLCDFAEGDFRASVGSGHGGRFAEIAGHVDALGDRLSALVGRIGGAAAAAHGGVGRITRSSEELSRRADTSAAHLAAAVEAADGIAALVRRTDEAAARARDAAGETSSESREGLSVVKQAVDAIAQMQRSVERIDAIVEVVDGIAFQTNLLALNASVEAARAGAAGRGFSVVAAEVRQLAQRVAGSAAEIRALIETSGETVRDASRLGARTMVAFEAVDRGVDAYACQIGGIADACGAQTRGVDAVQEGLRDVLSDVTRNRDLSATAKGIAAEIGRDMEAVVAKIGVLKARGERDDRAA